MPRMSLGDLGITDHLRTIERETEMSMSVDTAVLTLAMSFLWACGEAPSEPISLESPAGPSMDSQEMPGEEIALPEASTPPSDLTTEDERVMGGEEMSGGSENEEPPGGDHNEGIDAIALDDLVDSVVAATCDSLSRCCNGDEVLNFWRGIVANERLAHLASSLPPEVEYNADTCLTMLSDVFVMMPLGPWIEAVRSGQASYDAEAAHDCVERLNDAQCGPETTQLLFEGDCFSFQPPLSGDRRPFSRLQTESEECTPIADGVGGAFYGTCDPHSTWCATMNDATAALTPIGSTGVCVAAAAEGEPCGLFPSVSVCQRGLECGLDDVCVAKVELVDIPMGETCYDRADFTVLGDCADGYCDVLGSNLCEPAKSAGSECSVGYQCQSGNCLDSLCSERAYCGGF